MGIARLSLTWLVLALVPHSPLGVAEAAAAEPAAFSSWAKRARVGGAAVWLGMTATEMNQLLDALVAQNVSVVEADSDLSNYLTDAVFEQELALMRQFSAAARARGLKVVWYYPSLEVITPNGVNLSRTMYKDHPDWVQRGLDGTPNVFYGGSGQVFWVEPGDESAWMSPSSPYRDYFIDRVKRIVRDGGVDGLWVDVPIYADFGPTMWTDRNPYAVSRFRTVTGMTAPTAVNWNDPVWRRWIAWRHEEIAAFLTDVAAAARAINPEFPLIIETLPTDYNGATIYGLDGATLKNLEGVTHVWEVDIMSNATGMRMAREDDWISFISAFKYARAASGSKPSWVFSYGVQPNDATLVMAEAMAAGNNPYELKVPEMTTTVGSAFRQRMFGWAKANEARLWDARSAAKVAVLYSGPSRDYVDQFAGLGMFVTTQSGGDDLWWAESSIDSAYQRQYLAEFRGMIKLLVHNHIPFDVVVAPNPGELEAYRTVILPNVEAISDGEAARIRQFVDAGGQLLVTGPNPTGMNEFGASRSNYALADVLGFNKGATLPAESTRAYGAGTVRYFSARLGKAYFAQGDATAGARLKSAIEAGGPSGVASNADRRVHFELRQSETELSLQLVNFIGVTGSFSVVPTTFSVTLTLPPGKRATAVGLTSPDHSTPALVPLAYSDGGSSVTFQVNLQQYAMAVVSLTSSGTVNRPPTLRTPIPDTSTTVGANFSYNVAANFTDPDGDALTYAASLTGGAVLPSWLFFQASTGVFTGIPPSSAAGTLSIDVAARDPSNASVSDTFLLTITGATVNSPPTLRTPIPDTSTTAGASFSLNVSSHFSDPDGDVLSYAATLTGGGALPSWLSFQGSTGVFTGIPPSTAVGTYSIDVTARDPSNATVRDTFVLSVTSGTVNAAPIVRTPIPDTSTTAGASFSLNVSSHFSDPDGDVLSYAATLTGGGALPSWLSFQGSTGVFTGVPPSTAVGTYSIDVTARDPSNATVRDTFVLTVNAAPTQTLQATFVSLAAEDGWVREWQETRNTGSGYSNTNNGSEGIRVGDDDKNRQVKSILSFDTASLPDGAVVTAVTLELTRGTDVGANALATHGPCYVDIRRGHFGSSAALESMDFEASADAVAVGQIVNGGGAGTLYAIPLDAAALSRVNVTGRTQLRLYCTLDDDNDRRNDLTGFYPGDNATVARRPRLVVTYR